MNCDLCKRDKSNSSRLCDECGDTIKRLLAIQERLEAPSTCEAARLALVAKAPCSNCAENCA